MQEIFLDDDQPTNNNNKSVKQQQSTQEEKKEENSGSKIENFQEQKELQNNKQPSSDQEQQNQNQKEETKNDNLNNSNQLKIQIDSLEPAGKDQQNHQLFKINGFYNNQQFEVLRNNVNFEQLYKILTLNCCPIIIFPIPVLQVSEPQSQELFKADLLTYLKKLISKDYIKRSNEIKIFLQIDVNYQNLEKKINENLNTQAIFVLKRLEDYYTKYQGQKSSKEDRYVCQKYMQVVKEVLNKYENYIKICQNTIQSQKDYARQYEIFFQQVLPLYETRGIFIDSQYMYSSNQGNKEYIDGVKEHINIFQNLQYYKQFYQTVIMEKKYLESFLENYAIIENFNQQSEKSEKRKQDLQLQLQNSIANKQLTMKQKLDGRSKDQIEQQLKYDIQNAEKEQQMYETLMNYIYNILYNEEIKYFKDYRGLQYRQILKAIALHEIEQAKNTIQFWENTEDLVFQQQDQLNKLNIFKDFD